MGPRSRFAAIATPRWLVPVALSTLAAVLVACSSTAQTGGQAQTNLTKPVRLLVNQAAGGDADRLARILEPSLEKKLGVEFNIENVTEAGGVQAVNQLYTARPDGTTLATLLLPRTVQQEVLLNTQYKTRELTPIAVMRRGVFVVITKKDAPYKDFKEMVEASKKQALSVGTSGAGSATDLQTARIADVAGANFTRVPFNGTAPAAAAVLGGHVDAAVVPVEIMRSGDYRAIVVPTENKLAGYPEIPSMGDMGMKAADVSFFQVLFGPPKMDEGMRSMLESNVKALLSEPEVQKLMTDGAMESYFGTGADLTALIEEQAKIVDQYKELLKG